MTWESGFKQEPFLLYLVHPTAMFGLMLHLLLKSHMISNTQCTNWRSFRDPHGVFCARRCWLQWLEDRHDLCKGAGFLGVLTLHASLKMDAAPDMGNLGSSNIHSSLGCCPKRTAVARAAALRARVFDHRHQVMPFHD